MISYELYNIIIAKKAQKVLNSLTQAERKKIVLKIKSLTSPHPASLSIKKLQGYKNLYRIKIDDYRILFIAIPDKKIIVIPVIGHRKEIYNIAKRILLNDF